ncbi:TPA: baseplate J/gp47 family protein [Clostridium botulinum]|nr:baseplate J/gp47 family protein [Clostridium botulinum]
MERDLLIPEFLQEDADTIHERMLEKAPPNVSTIEGDFYWDNTRPTAEEKASLMQVQLQNMLRLAFPQTSYGVWLEYLGECKGVFKNPPTKSIGVIKVIGKKGTNIYKDKLIGTVATDDSESVVFKFTENKAIDETGVAHVKAECIKAGTIGNVLKNTITVLIDRINGIESICNEEGFTGGTDLEDEEHYRERVLEEYKNEATSGNNEHYKKWAKEVDGVGYAYVIDEWNGPGTVKVLILDKNNKPATRELIDKVQNYIYEIVPKEENRGGKAPIGAIATIDTPITLVIDIKANFKFKEDFNSEIVLNSLKENLSKYLSGIPIGGTILYTAIHTIVGSMILTGEGIEDFKNLTVNGITENIKLIDQVAVIGEVTNIQ